MLTRQKSLILSVVGALFLMPALVLMPTAAQAQIFSDGAFLAGSYSTNGAGNQDIRFNINYSNIDIFGDDFLTASIPEAPRSAGGAATTGVFLSANNDSTLAGTESFSAIIPNAAAANVGNGTANENYVLRVDVFHSSAAGIDDGSGDITRTGSTNYSILGLNQSNTTVQVGSLNTGGAGTGGLAGQGLGLAITGDGGAGDDYLPIYGGARYADRDLGEEPGQLYTQFSNNATTTISTGLLGDRLNDLWEAQGLGFEFDDTDENFENDLSRATGNATYLAPDPNDLSGFPLTAVRQPYVDAFPVTTDPLHYECGASNCGLTGDEFLVGTLAPGVPVNEWATHELYWVDGQFTYVIDGVPVQQITPDNDTLNGDDNVFNAFSDSGAPLLAIWDRFGGSISVSPEGANFVIFDNLELATATTGDVPDLDQFLIDSGYLPSTGADADFDNDGDVDADDLASLTGGFGANANGDADGDGDTDGNDFLLWQRQFTGSAGTVASIPEPSTAVLLLGLAWIGLLGRRSL